mmetsp:Transcript_71740/g.210690  ORF Transcript_71740/g.210690 Transcript_71740/m.210690 type:complete len:200 (-) Transcript_71740:585-1184(-)
MRRFLHEAFRQVRAHPGAACGPRRHLRQPGREERQPDRAERTLTAAGHQALLAHGWDHRGLRDGGGVPRHRHRLGRPHRGRRPARGAGGRPRSAAAAHERQEQHQPPGVGRGRRGSAEVLGDPCACDSHAERSPQVAQSPLGDAGVPAAVRDGACGHRHFVGIHGRLLLRLRRHQFPWRSLRPVHGGLPRAHRAGPGAG